MGTTARRVNRRRTTSPLAQHVTTHGIVGVTALAIGLRGCDKLPAILAAGESFIAHSALWIALATLAFWFGRSIIRAFIYTVNDWPRQRAINESVTGKSCFWKV